MCSSCIVQVLSLFASFGVIAMTYHVYRLSHRHALIDNYLKQIIDLYYRIEDISKQLNSEPKLNEVVQNRCFREVRVNCSLMIYYLTRYPGFYRNRIRFEYLLNDIIARPEDESNYDSLANAFRDFCQNIRKDSKHEKYHIFINGRENGYPEKEL